jgi:hypothetical protein
MKEKQCAEEMKRRKRENRQRLKGWPDYIASIYRHKVAMASPEMPELSRLRIQFVHGGGWSPQRPNDVTQWPLEFLERRCADASMARCPDTTDFGAVVRRVGREIASFRPDVLVGKSQGGPTILKLMKLGVWKGPAVLLCPALFYGFDDFVVPETQCPALVACLGSRDVAVPPHVGEALVRENQDRATRGEVLLRVVDDDHSLRCLADEQQDTNLASLLGDALAATIRHFGVRSWSEVDVDGFSAQAEDVEALLGPDIDNTGAPAGAAASDAGEESGLDVPLNAEIKDLWSSPPNLLAALSQDLAKVASRISVEGWPSAPPSNIEFKLKEVARADTENATGRPVLREFLQRYADSNPGDAAAVRRSLKKMGPLADDEIDPVFLFHESSFWAPFGLPARALRAVLDEAVRLQDVWNSHSRAAAGFKSVHEEAWQPGYSRASSRHLSLRLSSSAISLLSSDSIEIALDDDDEILDVLDDNGSSPASEVVRVLVALHSRLGCNRRLTEDSFAAKAEKNVRTEGDHPGGVTGVARRTADFLEDVVGASSNMVAVLKLVNQRIPFVAMRQLRLAASRHMGGAALNLLVPEVDTWRIAVAFSFNTIKVTHTRTEVSRSSFEWPFSFTWELTCTLKQTDNGGASDVELEFVNCSVRTLGWSFDDETPHEKRTEIRQAFRAGGEVKSLHSR